MDLFERLYEITVDGYAVEALRVGFTVEKSLGKHANTAECALYNLSEASRTRLHRAEGVKVAIKAGYKSTGMTLIFAGEMRAAYSRPERDGSWITIIRAGDGDKGIAKGKTATGLRPGVSLDRVVSDLARGLGVGIGNAAKAFLGGDIDGVGKALTMGFTASGSPMEQLDKVARATGREVSVQDGKLQVLSRGRALSGVTATVLNARSGLEGTPEVDAKGLMSCRVRIVPGILPGMPVLVESAQQAGRAVKGKRASVSGLWRVDKVKFVGDLWGQDWNGELTCRPIG